MTANGRNSLAVLNDADNAPANAIAELLEEVCRFGTSS
jgi:hypothetical protein